MTFVCIGYPLNLAYCKHDDFEEKNNGGQDLGKLSFPLTKLKFFSNGDFFTIFLRWFYWIFSIETCN